MAFSVEKLERMRPSNLCVAETDARPVTERLILDAGCDPVPVGGPERARALEDCGMSLFGTTRQAGLGSNSRRYVRVGDL